MPFIESPLVLAGVVVYIALSAVAWALPTQIIVGRILTSSLVGPAIAFIVVIFFWRLQKAGSPK
jgi:hypothetical protein